MEAGMSRVFREVVEPEGKRQVVVHPQRMKAIRLVEAEERPSGF